jgi:hypothetical protein
MTLPEEKLNGIPWELCSFAAVALRAGKPFNWEELIPDIEREKRFWMAQGFIPHDLSALGSYLKNRSWPLSKCDTCGQPQCRSYPSYLWHLLRPGKVFSFGPKGFGLHFLCTWCMKEFLAGGKSECAIGFCSPQEPVVVVMPQVPAPSRSQLNRRQRPTAVIQ